MILGEPGFDHCIELRVVTLARLPGIPFGQEPTENTMQLIIDRDPPRLVVLGDVGPDDDLPAVPVQIGEPEFLKLTEAPTGSPQSVPDAPPGLLACLPQPFDLHN